MVRPRGARRVSGCFVRRPGSALTAFAMVMCLLAGACTAGSDDQSAASATPEQPTSTQASDNPTPPPDPSPSATAVPTATPKPSPTPDPLIVEAEDVAVTYFLAIRQIVDDVRIADASDAIHLEAVGGPLENYALRLINETLKSNDYLEFDDLRWEVVGSEIVNPNVKAVDVTICVHGPGVWRDFDTDEVTLTSASSDPFALTYQVRTDGDGSSLKVWTFVDTDDEGQVVPCELANPTS